MGVVLSAVKIPASKTGKYFDSNWTWWGPLWTLICRECEDILTEEDREHGYGNDGHEISEGKALLIADRLGALLDTPQFEKQWAQAHLSGNPITAAMKSFLSSIEGAEWESAGESELFTTNKTRQFVEDFIRFARGSGGFAIW